MIQLKCKLAEYVILYSAKLMWGMECDIEKLYQEILKLEGYIQVLDSLETANDCEDLIPASLTQKITSYINSLDRESNRNCRHCPST